MKSKIKNVVLFLILSVFSLTISGQTHIQPPEVKKKVEHLLTRMTLEEKIGQMTQVALEVISKKNKGSNESHEIDMEKLRTAVVKYKVGSILNVVGGAYSIKHWHKIIEAIQDVAAKETRLKIPVLYGIDSVHGANYITGTTIFPQSIGMAATFNPELVKKEGKITAYETRASGIPWNFNPVLDLGREPLWPRLFETYGEDPYLASVMAKEYIKGLEGENNAETIKKDRMASCIKHYLGYSFPLSGKDRTPAWIPERMLREYFLPPFYHGVLSGAHTLMINSTEINGIPVHASPFYLKKILRDELGFEGLAVSDWLDIKNLHTRSRVAKSHREAVKIAVMAGVDMSMVPLDFSFFHHLLDLVKEGEVPLSRIDEAVKRILMVKYKLDLFENPYPDKTLAKKVGCQAFTAVALDAACESITLLKNKNRILPLPLGKNILITGPNADKLSVLNSGWTYTWQGDDEKRYPQEKDTILEAIRKKFAKDKVVYAPGCAFDKEIDIQTAIQKAKEVDVIIACLGEKAYCETPGIIDDLTLPEVQLTLVSQLYNTGKPIVLVLTEGRPRLIHKIFDKVDAIVLAYLPGNEGGQAIAEVLTGEVNPSGKLPITYPKYPNDLKCYDYKYSENTHPNKYDPEFPFGFGLSYTEFEYKNLSLDKKVIKTDERIQVTVTVKNKGTVKGKEVVQLYVSDLYASITPSVKRLKRFKKIDLEPGEEKKVSFTLFKEDLSFIGIDMKPTIEPGEFKITVGPLTKNFKVEL
jgi:beta-glucosidase